MTRTAATKFQVRWRKSDEPDTLWSSPVDVGKDGNVKVPGLERVSDYVFQARAGSECGAWSDWVIQTFNMPEAAAPEAVSSLTAQSVADGVHLAWASIIADGGTVFSIERSTSADSGFAERMQTRATAYTDPETSGTIYYYRVRAINYRGGVGPYSNVVSSKGVSVDVLGDDVAAAQTAADNAQHAADAANAQLAAIASDNTLSPAEKPAVIRDYDVITTEQAGIDGQATAYGITTEKTAYDNAVSALTAYLATLTADTAWDDKSGNTSIVSATFKDTFAAVYTTRQALLNQISATAKTSIDSNTPFIRNPNFTTGDLTGWTVEPGVTGWGAQNAQATSPNPAIPTYVSYISGSATNTALRNKACNPCQAGDVVIATCQVACQSGGGNGYVRIIFYNSSSQEISGGAGGNQFTGNASGTSRAMATAPAGAVYCLVAPAVAGYTTGVFRFTAFTLSLSARSMDEVPDSSTRFAAVEAGADKTAGKSIDVLNDGTTYMRKVVQSTSIAVDNSGFELPLDSAGAIPGWMPSQGALSLSTTSYHSGAQSLRLQSGTAYGGAVTVAKYSCAGVTSFTLAAWVLAPGSQPAGIALNWYTSTGASAGTAAITTTPGGAGWVALTVTGKPPAGAAYMQPSLFSQVATNTAFFDDVTLTQNDLTVAGSGVTVGDQRNLLPVTWAGVRSVLSTSPISYSISGTTVSFSVAAFTLQGGGISVSYSASSGSVTQAAGTTIGYYLYYRDATASGGSKALNITTAPQALAAFPDIVMLGTANVTVASSGGGSGGTGGGGGGFCVADDMYIGEGRLAGNAEIGDPFDCIDLPTQAGKHVRALQGVSRGMEECVRMITSDGCALVCSMSTPFDLPDGRNTTAPRMLGEQVITDLGTATVISLALVGPKPVTRAHLGGVSYAAGADPHRRIYSHNSGVIKP